jgi:tripartite-type tricarboxylate transporter receptor subunit TctC
MADVRERITQSGQTVSPLGPEEFGRMMRADFERWRKVVATAGIRPE